MFHGAVPQWAVGPLTLVAFTVVAYLLGKLVVKPAVGVLVKRKSTTLRGPVSRAVLYITILVGLVAGLSASGYGQVLGVFGAVVAAGTLAIGFAMQDTISAAVSGVFLLVDKPFQIGDWIEWDDQKGRVEDIRVRTTKVETFDNELLTVPNDKLANTTIKNPVANDQLRVQLSIGIGYEDDIDEAKQIVQEILEDNDKIADEPAPDIKLVGLGDSTVDFKARYWVDDPKRAKFMTIKEEVLRQVKDRFDEAGIDMPYPTMTIAGDSIELRE
ncbi:MAG: mechanosensitive ion channel family protein [Candidatus Nanohaloarchaea archaeon]|nr:mechanosensitive ion channel family protein [Candidatus Nanohaloarchaea archaeon]